MKLNLKIVAASAVAMMSSAAAFGAASIVVTSTAFPTTPVVPGTYTYSKEGLALAGTATATNKVTLPNVVVTFGNNLTYQDDIILTIPGVTPIAPTISPTLVQCTGAGANAVGYVQLVANGWNFRVTDVSGITVGASCTFTGLSVTASSLANTNGVLSYQANRGLTTPTVIVDGPVSTAANSLAVKTQFAINVDQKLNGVINVYKDRMSFTPGETVAPGGTTATPQILNDTLNFSTFTFGSPVVSTWTGPLASVTGSTIKINGDWSWVEGTDTNTTCDKAEFQAAVQSNAANYANWTVDTTSTCQQLVMTENTPAVGDTDGYNDAATGFVTVPGTVKLSTTDWTGTVSFAYTLSTDSTVKGSTDLAWDPGAWTMNGAQVYIQYMPYGTGISRIIYAANRGGLTPDASADITYGGSVFSCPLGTLAAKTVNELSGKIDQCVAARGITSGKVAILLTVIAPDSDIEVYSAYNVGGNDRGTVVNTSNGRAFFYGTGVNFNVTPAN